METKAELRQRFQLLARDFFHRHNAPSLAEIHQRIAAALFAYCEKTFTVAERSSPRVAIYQPLRFELPAREIVELSRSFSAPTYLYPQTEAEKMWFVDDAGALHEPEILIVPGLFVDRAGNRLGRGKGFYDRYLREKKPPLSRRIFLGYDFQFIALVPSEAQDERVTPIGLLP